jgi:hypothetical protein
MLRINVFSSFKYKNKFLLAYYFEDFIFLNLIFRYNIFRIIIISQFEFVTLVKNKMYFHFPDLYFSSFSILTAF